jgi:hypothetical protein
MASNHKTPFDADHAEVASYIKSEQRDVSTSASDVVLTNYAIVIQFEAR